VFLLTIAAAALCLSLLFTTASDAQTRAESQNATAAAGGEDCLEFEDEAADETDETGEGDADEDAEIDAAEEDGDIDEDAADDLTSQDGDANLEAQQVQGENQSSFRVQNDNTGAFQQSLQADPSGEFAQSLEDRDEDDGGLSPEDTDGDNADTSEDGENADTTDDDNNNETDDNDTDNNDDEQDAEGEDEEECVVAESVPDEPLLPTGAPAKAGSNETAKDKSGSEKQGETERKTERKTEGKSGGKQADSAGKRTGGGKKLEVQDRGKKIEVEDRSGKTPRQEKSGSRTKSVSPKDERQEKARSGNSSSEKPRTESARPGSPRAGSERPDPDSAESSRTESVRASDLAPRLAAAEWSSPSREEIDLTERPRRFAPDPGAEMTLSVRAMGLYDVPVANSNRLEELDRGLVRMPETSLPWDASAQRNVFVAGHYLGLPETQSRMVFYNLDKLKSGDEMVLKDNLGQTYKYRVSEKFAAGPEDSWVMGEVRGRDMLTLQTCIPPDFGKRLVVRADRVQ
jgi:sortase A